LWIALLVFTGGSAATRCAAAETDSLALDEAWFASLARAESLMAATSRCGEVDSAEGAAVVEQIRIGVHVLGSFVRFSVAADTMVAGPLATVRPPAPPLRKHRILGAAGAISAVTSLAHVFATLSGASPQTRRALAYVGGSAAAVGGIFRRPPSRSATTDIERMRSLSLETELRESVYGTEGAAEMLWVELGDIALDSCATSAEAVWLARRYANALQEVSVIVDFRVARSLSIARSCADYPGFAAESRERCAALASHLEALGAMWQERRWLLERSKKNTLDYLVLADRP